jgi:glucose-fructose oxidoreductase
MEVFTMGSAAMNRGSKRKVRYAVIGQGWFSQAAVLPAFENAQNAELFALFSGDPSKLKKLGEKYKVPHTLHYSDYDGFLEAGLVDAVYIVLPNSMHCEYTVRAARAGVHVLCEKPMAVSEDECEEMIRACDENRVKLMIGYRLHFEEANLKAIEVVRSGEIGKPRIFNSVFTMQVRENNIRVKADLGGGPLYDIGVYCINAARYIFREEPEEVTAFTGAGDDRRFREVEEQVSAMLRFSGGRLATFTAGFGAEAGSAYDVVGTKGRLRVCPAYEFSADLRHELTVEGKTQEQVFKKRDQIGPEITYFSDCILKGETPEPSGWEGLADVRIIRALYRSAETGRSVALAPFERARRPGMDQESHAPPVSAPKIIRAETPSH